MIKSGLLKQHRLRVFPLSLSPSCVTRQKTVWKIWPHELLGQVFFRIIFRSQRLWTRLTTCSLQTTPKNWLMPVLRMKHTISCKVMHNLDVQNQTNCACGWLLIRLLLNVATKLHRLELSSFFSFFSSQDLLGTSNWHVDRSLADCMRSPLMRLCTKYVMCFVHRVPGVHVSTREGGGGNNPLVRIMP